MQPTEIEKHKIENLLFACLRSALFEEKLDASLFSNLSNDEWEALFNLSNNQGVCAIVYDSVTTLPRNLLPQDPCEIMYKWVSLVDDIENDYKNQREVEKKLLDLFAANNIKTMIFKGSELSKFYKIPEHRECSDIDIYLPSNYKKGNEILIDNGAIIDHITSKHASLIFDGVCIENHSSILTKKYTKEYKHFNLELDNELKKSTVSENRFIPTANYSLLHLLEHAAEHFGLRMHIRQLCDWALFLKSEKSNIDIPYVKQIISKAKLNTFYDVITSLSNDIFEEQFSAFMINSTPDKKLKEAVLTDIMENEAQLPHGFLNLVKFKLNQRSKQQWKFKTVLPENSFSRAMRTMGTISNIFLKHN